MPRRAKPWFRASRNMFMGFVGGKQVPLQIPGPDSPEQRNKAETAFLALLQQFQGLSGPMETKAQRTVAAAVDEYLHRCARKVSPECFRQYQITLSTHFSASFGSRAVASMQVDEIESWADRPEWSNSTRNNNLGAVATFLKWAKHPLALKRPPKDSRGADAVLTQEQFDRVLAAYDETYGGDFRQLLCTLRATGARPQEIARLTAESVDWSNACTRQRQHKTRRHVAERVIYFNSDAMGILRAQHGKHPAGFLFRTRRGTAYSQKMIGVQMRRLSKRVGFRAIAYGERHAFATTALIRGVPDALVAGLLGHTSTAMVTRNYGHIAGQGRALREAAERLVS